ncbi:hypothetical protein QJQ45_019564 [Haematococcus lacustris]|nr:hypothetical protein QJQ45_019564 [Haematococcus lacustris]
MLLQRRLSHGLASPSPRCINTQSREPLRPSSRRRNNTVPASSAGDASGGSNSGDAPQAVALTRSFPSVEYTFVLAGFLKILTIGGLANTAPVDTVRTLAGQMAPWFMVPVSLVMCLVAKLVVDNGLQESKRFMAALLAFLVFMYFGLYRLFYKMDVVAELPMRAKPNMSGPMAKLRAQLGDREIGAPPGVGVLQTGDSRSYVTKGKKGYGAVDDFAYYEGRYASDVAAEALLTREERLAKQAGGATPGEEAEATGEFWSRPGTKVARRRVKPVRLHGPLTEDATEQ